MFNFDETTSIDLQGYNGLGGQTRGYGEMHLTFVNPIGERNMVIVKDVHWVPNARDACLFSVEALCERECKFTLDGKEVSWILFSLVNSYLMAHFKVELTLCHVKLKKLHLSKLLVAPSTSGIVH